MPKVAFTFLLLAYCCAAGAPHPKVQDRVWADTEQGEQFLVVLAEQTDTRPFRAADRRMRGRQIVAALRATASRTQAPLRALAPEARAFWAANVLVVRGNKELVEILAARPEVAWIESDRPFPAVLSQPEAVESLAPPAAVEWNVAKIRAPELWALGVRGSNTVYANADTGVDWTHPALKNQYRGVNGASTNHNYHWWDAIHADISGNGTNPRGFSTRSPVDDNGHGTHTTGTGAGYDGGANQVGVAPGVRWIACRNMDEGVGRPSTYIECLQFFLAPTDLDGNNPNPDLRPDVVGNSYGCPPSELCAPNSLHLALENLRAAGVFMAVSAGNAGPGCGSINDPPALDAASITVGATGADDAIASLSSRGPVTVDGSQRPKPELVAPGVSVRSADLNHTYTLKTGTSMASPHVAGAAALLWSGLPHFRRDVDQTQALLQRTAVPFFSAQLCGNDAPNQVPNNVYGYGRVDVAAAYYSADFDLDGVPDYWELRYSLDPTTSGDAEADADQDGMSNRAEFLAGTNPRDFGSALRVRALRGSNDVVRWDGIGGKRYRVQYETNLQNAMRDFSAVQSNAVAAGTPTTMSFTNRPPLPSQRYYRVRLE